VLIPLVSLLVLCALSGPISGQQVQVETRDGRTVTGALGDLRDDWLRIDTNNGPSTVPLSELLLLVTLPATAEPPDTLDRTDVEAAVGAPDLLFLAAPSGGVGDRLVGRVMGGDAYGLRFAIDGGVTFDVPFEEIERLLPAADQPVDRLALLEGAGADDRVWRRRPDGSLDSLTGVVAGVTGTDLSFESALGPLTFALPEVLGVVFAPSPAPARALPGPQVVVRLVSGTRLQGGLLELDAGTFTLATRLADRLTLPTAALASLVQRGRGDHLLADLHPTHVEERPSIGGPDDFLFPWRADLSVTGRPLSVGGVLRATGLGVHSNARLGFELPEGVTTLRVTVGLSDEVAELPAEGSVRFRVYVDGERRADSNVLRGGDTPKVLRVTGLEGARLLELVVDDAGDDDAGDRAAWVDGVLLTSRN
jgi:small nuclear ribonucleoprotein (snRNP)-like protein